jgi:hypothetical protein
MDKFQVPVSFDSANRRKDRSIRMSFSSLFEMNTEDYMEIDKQLQQSGWLVFASKAVNDVDIPDEDFETDLKSPSKRLRSVLYVYHMEKDGDPAKFRQFYETTMEKYIQKVKDSID